MDAVALMKDNERKDLLRFVTAGSVDDGKSTLIGRLLFESKGIYEDQLAAVQKASELTGSAGGDLDLALVTDGLRAEREQGITIDVAYRYFSTPRRKFIIADTPGHEQYTRNTATGASTANLVIILIDATKGVLTQSKRHSFIAALLGIPHFVIAVNKMDLVDYSQKVFEEIRNEYTEFAAKLEVSDLTFIPVSALRGDNVVAEGENMPWYKGTTLLNHLETVHIASDRNLIDLRFPVQTVLRPDRTFRGYQGTVASGAIKPGDEVMVVSSGKRTKVDKVLSPDGEVAEAYPPMAATVTLTDEIDISRGDMLVHVNNVPRTGKKVEAMIVWMSDQPMSTDKTYLLKHTTRSVNADVPTIRYRVDVNTLHRSDAAELKLNEIGRCVIDLARPIAYDPYTRNRATGAFILIDKLTNNTVGAGMILDRDPNERVADDAARVREPRSRDMHRHASKVSPVDRSIRLGHMPATVWLTGLPGSGKSTIAYALEQRLFEMNCLPRVLDGENARLTYSKDLGFSANDRAENIRRSAEVAKLLNETGLVAICAFASPYEDDRRIAREIVGADHFIEVYLSAPAEVCRERRPEAYAKADSGDIANFTGVSAPYEAPDRPELKLPTDKIDIDASVDRIVALLTARGLLDLA